MGVGIVITRVYIVKNIDCRKKRESKMVSALLTIIIALTLSYILGEISKKIGLPRIVGSLVTGILLTIGYVKQVVLIPENQDFLSLLADLGVILLFYYIGLEAKFEAFGKNVKRSVMISLFNSLIPFAMGFFVCHYLFGFDLVTTLVVSVALSVSSQAVAIDILDELNFLKSKIANMILFTVAVDDIIEMVLITGMLSFLHIAITKMTLSRLCIEVLIFVGIMLLIRFWILPWVLKFFEKEKSSTGRFTISLIVVLIIASLAEYFSVGYLIGALIAGIITKQTIYKDPKIANWKEHDVARSIHIIAFGFLIPLFFVWVGSNIDLSMVGEHVGFILIFTLIATVGTVLGTALAVYLTSGTFHEGLILGWGLNAKGDLELVIASLSLKASLIEPYIFSGIVMMSLLTTIISPIVFAHMIKRKMGVEPKVVVKRKA